MQVGISTASLFGRKLTEEALEFFANNNVPCAEVFLESFCEYNKEFGEQLSKIKSNVNVHSFHVLTTQIEPQLYSLNQRAMEDSFKILEGALACAKEMGAKYYTFHGGARFKKLPFKMDYERVGKITQRIIDCAKAYGITIARDLPKPCVVMLGTSPGIERRNDVQGNILRQVLGIGAVSRLFQTEVKHLLHIVVRKLHDQTIVLRISHALASFPNCFCLSLI